MECDTLFLEGSSEDSCIQVSHESLVALFVLQYCQNPSVAVVFIQDDNCHLNSTDDHSQDVIQKKPECHLNGRFPINASLLKFPVQFRKRTECQSLLLHCILPAVIRVDGKWCTTGLCSCLRYILHRITDKHVGHFSQGLLGFRKGCLQACAEVSVWTKFCELESVETLMTVWTAGDTSDQSAELTFPQALLRFEQHLAQPPILHNALKKKQQHIRETTSDKCLRDELVQLKLNELPELSHSYAEGCDMTLADMILFVCFHVVLEKWHDIVALEKICPRLMQWHSRILSDNKVGFLMPLLELCSISVRKRMNICPHVNIVIPHVPCESLYKSDPQRYKPSKRPFTHQDDINRILANFSQTIKNLTYASHPAADEIILPWSTFPSAVNPTEGDLPASRLIRKCQQLDNVVSAALKLALDGNIIVDFCAGGGHVGIILAYCLPLCSIILVENKETSLRRAEKRVAALQLTNVTFIQSNLDYFVGKFNMGVALHSCGVATDLILQKCLDQRASFVTCPCCYGALCAHHILEYPRSALYHSICRDIDEYLILGHAADQTHDVTNPKTEQGQLCMRLIDHDRLLHAEASGYQCRLILMEPTSCSPKNHLLIGVLLP